MAVSKTKKMYKQAYIDDQKPTIYGYPATPIDPPWFEVSVPLEYIRSEKNREHDRMLTENEYKDTIAQVDDDNEDDDMMGSGE